MVAIIVRVVARLEVVVLVMTAVIEVVLVVMVVVTSDGGSVGSRGAAG